jgi:hypothetical protein
LRINSPSCGFSLSFLQKAPFIGAFSFLSDGSFCRVPHFRDFDVRTALFRRGASLCQGMSVMPIDIKHASPDQKTSMHGRGEFIALIAAIMAINALAVDIMLPGLPQIGASLGVQSENHVQFVITAYLLGFGVSQLFYGPLSDRFGRRAPLFGGLVIYVLAALGAAMVKDFTTLIILRVLQGLGAAGTLCRTPDGGSHVAGDDDLHDPARHCTSDRTADHAVRRMAPDLPVHGYHGVDCGHLGLYPAA